MGGGKRKYKQKEKIVSGTVEGDSPLSESSNEDELWQKTKGVKLEDKRKWKILWLLSVFFLAFVFSVLHRNHVAFMFESDRHFSHLSDLEREMTFRTEMGLYFSYFKTLIQAPTFIAGLHEITHDNVSEYGHTINTLKRFNLYPEVVLAFMYRTYKSLADKFKWKIQECWTTNRGQGLDPIVSCEGMGNSHYFYINHVFALSGTVAGVLFLFGTLLSDSILGGLLAVAGFFFNHGEATRVQWTPPLRESFGYPVFLIEMLVVTYIVKHRKSGFISSGLVAFLSCSFMLQWQFAQFALSTQVGSLFVCYMLDYIPATTLRTITYGFQVGFLVAFGLLFGNEMLLTSLFLSSIITLQFIMVLDNVLKTITFRPFLWLIQLIIFITGTLGIKYVLGSSLALTDDAHIFDILKSKFTDYNNFHTRLYTCAVEFDFLQIETYWKLLWTLLLPAASVSFILIAIQILKTEIPVLFWRPKETGARKRYAEVVYNCVQLGTFTVSAVLIMRLKLFWTPHLCILASMLASKRLLFDLFRGYIRPIWQQSFCVCILAMMAFSGLSNIQQQWSIMGEYSNIPQEQLFDWIVTKTAKDAVFAGPMPTMANLKLSTARPIVMHPHYEDVQLRERVRQVYSVYSRKPPAEVHKTLNDMGVNYLVFEYGWCSTGGPRPECGLINSWDLDDPSNRNNEPLCEILEQAQSDKDIEPFRLAYRNEHYKVFKVQ